MEEKQGNGQQMVLILMSVAVLAISVWAFMQSIHVDAGEGVVQTTLSGGGIADTKETESQTEDVDVEALVLAVLEGVSFDTELAEQDAAVVDSMVMKAVEDTEVKLYIGDGTCADELLIIAAADTDSAKQEIESVQQHLTDMQQSFRDYLPKEAKKIDDAVILQKGRYIIACVCGDREQAKKIIEERLK